MGYSIEPDPDRRGEVDNLVDLMLMNLEDDQLL
ncbi:hypothetical protein J2S25_000016 [Mesobacillus stamsii]|uniref:Uncharacterized protein n=1 Tax=Mesobacillus stamsii TaxID=225347 RepID=A0ABU0FPL3_9BACI|nr:hypothetical protein [Mesobacillus stamsii]